MKVKDLVVADLVEPMATMESKSCSMEESCILECRICRKEKQGYIDLKTSKRFSKKQELGYCRVEEKTVTPLSDYYNRLGMKKKNNHKNKEKVYKRVKELKKEGKL